MATTIITKNGSGAPVAGDLVQGELAVDLTNKTLYSKDSSGNVFKVGDTGGGSPGTFTDLVATDSFTSPGIDDNATSTAITIDANENVGIGVTNPALQLEVDNSIFITDTTRPVLCWGQSGSNSTPGYITYFNDAAEDRLTLTAYGNHGLTGMMTFEAGGGYERMRIASNGNVGIGTTSTSNHRLCVKYDVNETPLRVESTLAGAFIRMTGTGGTAYVGQKDGGLAFQSASADLMRIDSSGSVGIGTTNPTLTGASGLHLYKATTTQMLRMQKGDGVDFNIQAKNTVAAFQTDTASDMIFRTSGQNDRLTISASGTTTVTGGFEAAQPGAGTSAFAAGDSAGITNQGNYATAVGRFAGNSNQGNSTVAIGNTAGQTSQSNDAVAVGKSAGESSQGGSSVAVGPNAGNDTQGANAVALGKDAGKTTQGSSAVAVGYLAGTGTQANNTVAVGVVAGQTSQGFAAVGVGSSAGKTNQGESAVAVGRDAGETTQGASAVAIGQGAANNLQELGAVAVGYLAGAGRQQDQAISIGQQAGQTDQQASSVAIGYKAGTTGQLSQAVAIGREAGKGSQGANSVALGRSAGLSNQGADSVAIGRQAGEINQGANGIIISSRGSASNNELPNHITIQSASDKYIAYNGSDTWSFAGGDVTVPNDHLLVGRTSTGAAATDHGWQVYKSGIVYQYADAATSTDVHRWYNGAGSLVASINARGEGFFLGGATYSGPLNADEIIQDGAPVIDTLQIIRAFMKLRAATADPDSTVEELRDKLSTAVNDIIDQFQDQIDNMPTPLED